MTKNENLLVIVMEECAEIQQAVSKMLRFGDVNSVYVMDEFLQLCAVVEMCQKENILPTLDTIEEDRLIKEKKEKVEYYQYVSEKNGRIAK